MKIKTFEAGIKAALILCLLITNTARATSYTLTLGTQGSGTVIPDNLNNPHPAGVVITITATPNAGWYFSNWTGDTNGAVNPLLVTMNSNLAITGKFLAFPTYTLALATNGQGSIGLSPAGGSYLSNSVVTATATPAAGWVFAGWTGSTNTSLNPLSLTINANSSLTGTFAQLPAFDVPPVGVTNVVGSTVSFSAHAVGNTPLGYQWFFSGGSLTNATNLTLTLTNVSSAQSGNYWIVATNNYGSATSAVVSLTLTNAGGSTNVVASADEASLRAAIKIGGWVGLGFNGTVTITNTINITNNVILDGSAVAATISGGSAVRLFYVAPGVTFMVTNVTLANGSCIVSNSTPGDSADGGAIYNNGGTVALVACTLTNNKALMQSVLAGGFARGGAIFNNGGSVSLLQCAISNSVVIGYNTNYPLSGTSLGGAIYNTNGAFVIIGCNISSNYCQSSTSGYGSSGGAVYQASGSLTAATTTFSQNLAMDVFDIYGGSSPPAYGGALAALAGSVTIDHCQFSANTAIGGNANHNLAGPAYGGAIYSAGMLTVKDSSFFENQTFAGGGSDPNYGPSANGYGGAIFNSGTAVLNRCSICSNLVQGGAGGGYAGGPGIGGNGLGGGIFNASQCAATNCTIAQNSAIDGSGSTEFYGNGTNGTAIGGGVFNNTNATFTGMNLTLASNSCNSTVSTSSGPTTNGFAAGSQIANTNGTMRLHNSLIAYGGANGNAYGTISDNGYNICSDGTAHLFSGSSYNNTDPQLGALAYYGGLTFCMALLPTSPAIDTADSLSFPSTDQRGFVRPFGSGPDIGAFEYGSYQPLLLYLSASAGSVQISYTTSLTGSYRLQTSTNLSTWTDVITNGPFASATYISQSISMQGFNQRYFRLLVQ